MTDLILKIAMEELVPLLQEREKLVYASGKPSSKNSHRIEEINTDITALVRHAYLKSRKEICEHCNEPGEEFIPGLMQCAKCTAVWQRNMPQLLIRESKEGTACRAG